MNSVCTHSFDSVIQSYVFIYYLQVDNSQISVSNPHFFPRFQTHMSNCLLDISTWVSNRYLKHVCRKLTFHCSISHPQAPSLQPVVFSILLMAAPSFYLFRMSSHPWFLPSIPRIQSVRRSFSYTLKHLESGRYWPPPPRSELLILILLTWITVASLLTGCFYSLFSKRQPEWSFKNMSDHDSSLVSALWLPILLTIKVKVLPGVNKA